MKAQMIEKSGFPKPLGLLLILIIMSLLCLVQCVFSQPLTVNIMDNTIYLPVVEEETGIQVEAWMIDDSCWLQEYKSGFIVEESEPEISILPGILIYEEFKKELADDDLEIEIEEWMIDERYWLKDNKSGLEVKKSKSKISTKQWILIYADLEQELVDIDPEPEIEEWMIDDSYWLISTKNCDKQNEVQEDK